MRDAVTNSIVARYLSIWVIAGLMLGIAGTRYNVTAYFTTEVIAYEKAATCSSTACLVEKRTLEVHARDAAKYLEQSRLTALYELNAEMQGMTYDSPYLDIKTEVR